MAGATVLHRDDRPVPLPQDALEIGPDGGRAAAADRTGRELRGVLADELGTGLRDVLRPDVADQVDAALELPDAAHCRRERAEALLQVHEALRGDREADARAVGSRSGTRPPQARAT